MTVVAIRERTTREDRKEPASVHIGMPKLLLAACVITSLSMVSAAQTGVDFSGSWVLDENQMHPAPDIPQRLVVRHAVASADLAGLPIPPTYLTMSVIRYFGDQARTETYSVGVTSTNRVRTKAEWRGDFLWVERQNLQHSGTIEKHQEAWRLDDLGRLVISITHQTVRTLAYRRDKP
jgi:hypothetical protein